MIKELWTKEETKKLKQLFYKGNSYAEISKLIGRSRSSIAGKVSRMDLSLVKTKTRTVLNAPWNRNPAGTHTRTYKVKRIITTAYGEPKPLGDLAAQECRFPLKQGTYCAGVIHKGSYCKKHYEVCHNLKEEKKDEK